MAKSELIHCLKCKKKTNTSGSQVVQTSNGRYMIRGECNVCGTKKNRFIPNPNAGSGVLG